MQFDLGLAQSSGVYSLVEPTTDPLARVANRWQVQLLSTLDGERGSLLASELAAGRVTTSAEVVTLYALTAAAIVSFLESLAYDIVPYRAELLRFAFTAPNTLSLRDRVYTRLGSVETETVVTA